MFGLATRRAADETDESPGAPAGPLAVRPPTIVVGGGPCGVRAAQELGRRGRDVVLFNAERWQPYNRVKLTPFFAGDVQIGQVYQPPLAAPDVEIRQYSDHRIVGIDTAARTVTGSHGRTFGYEKLILAVGARAHVPEIQGIGLPGVYTFRNLDDVEKLLARSLTSRHTAILGAGLLGLEVARGMAQRGVRTTVLDHGPYPMSRQLDEAAGALLAAHFEGLGITVRTSVSVRQILGEARVEGLHLLGGETIACDTVIVCTGIRSNLDLARSAGLAVGRGIAVNDQMQTSHPDVYAIGECAEHAGTVYGLVGPGLEQAAIAVSHICGERSSYRGSTPTTKLKVGGIDVFSMGDVDQLDQRYELSDAVWRSPDGRGYRRLVFYRMRLIGALGIGDWPEVSYLQQAVATGARLWPWQQARFRRTGRITDIDLTADVRYWPAAATVCNCTGVTRGQLSDAVLRGCASVEALSAETSAGTVCGSCRPHLQVLTGGTPLAEALEHWRPIAGISALAALVAAIAFFGPAWPYSVSAADRLRLDLLWIDGQAKQITGFTLLGLAVAAAALSLRKRIKRIDFGSFGLWRLAHTILAVLTVAVLFLHTGFNLGSNLNFALMLAFLATLALGATAGIVAALEHRLRPSPAGSARPPRHVPVWLHILGLWPLPVLLFAHVLTVYFY